MRSQETAPDHAREDKDEIKIGIGQEEMSAQEHKADVLRDNKESRDALEKEFIKLQDAYEKRKAEGITDEQKQKYEERIKDIRDQIAKVAKES